jgi:hypothetical protein
MVVGLTLLFRKIDCLPSRLEDVSAQPTPAQRFAKLHTHKGARRVTRQLSIITVGQVAHHLPYIQQIFPNAKCGVFHVNRVADIARPIFRLIFDVAV